MFTLGLVSDLIRSRMEADLALVDIDPTALETARRLTEKMLLARNAPIRLSASLERREVLPGATAVITTIGVGGRRAWEQDIFIPRKYGLYYPVGDTVGPGGSSRALRMIPAMVAIACDVLELAPEALFINYANPMAPVCRAVRKTTGANITGLCIGTYDTWQYLAQALGVSPDDLTFSCSGINHLTWFMDLRVRGLDAMPRLRQIASERLARLDDLKPEPAGAFHSSMDFPFSWQCVSWFGAYPAPQDRHVTEFFPQLFRSGHYYGKRLGVDEFSFEGTIAAGDLIYESMRLDAFNSSALNGAYFEKLAGEQEQVIEVIQSIRSNQLKKLFANLPNRGQAPDLPLEAIVETPAVTDGQGVRAIIQKPLPTAAAGILATRFQWVELIVEAALECNRDKFISALILDGGVQSPDVAVALADDLLAAQRSYLPEFR